MTQPFVQRASWIWSAEGTHAAPPPEAATPSHYQVRLFRRNFVLGDAVEARLNLHVSGDSRYVLYCNGTLVGRGPAKGDVNHHFYASHDVSPLLRRGANVLAALVLDMSRVAHRPAWLGAPCSVMTYAGGFVLEGSVAWASAASDVSGMADAAGAAVEAGAAVAGGGAGEDVSTGPGWKVAVDTAHRFQNANTTFEGYQGYFEHRRSGESPAGWTEPGFDDSRWAAATVLYAAERHENRRDPASPYGLMPRFIPDMEEGPPRPFAAAFLPGGADPPAEWFGLVTALPAATNANATNATNATKPEKSRVAALNGDTRAGGSSGRGRAPVRILPRTTVEILFDAGELTTAYPQIEVAGGAGSVVRLTYAEALRLPWNTPGATLLGRPQSLANLASHFADESTGWTFDRRGQITGWGDIWEPTGSAETALARETESPLVRETFEPLHWRAFRYVGLRITTADQPMEVHAIQHSFTAYPYATSAEFSCSDPRLEKIWRVALRTMRLCSHETFEDCPYYEQMQYAGDTMITSKIGMLASGDYRLSRQALLHFDWSRLPEGLTQSRYPSRLVQVIPSWSLHWITSARDYAACSGDLATVRDLLPGMRTVLDWFRRHAGLGGLPGRLPFWNITDWCPWWPRGVVPGADQGPTCIISAQYIVALDELAELCSWLGREPEAAGLRAEAAALRPKFHTLFWSESEGLYHDRPGGPELSQYGNAWAVLSGAAGTGERARMLQRFPDDPKLAPGSFFWWHAGFRALELAGVYDRMPEFLGPWHEMIERGLSTFVEENSYWRSLCHAWSAHPALEFMTRVLGVSPGAPGFATIAITPHVCGLAHARGAVCTPRGPVHVAWRAADGRFAIDIDSPAATPVCLQLPGGERHEFAGGKFSAEGSLPVSTPLASSSLSTGSRGNPRLQP